ncbi:MAG: sialate O-acetylesterase [Bacteroidia bacterium]
MHLLRLLLTAACCLPSLVASAVSLPAVFGDHMVVQRDAVVPLWGWGKPLEQVVVRTTWDTTVYRCVVDNEGQWQVDLRTPPAGGPHEIVVQGHNEHRLRDVLSGEVWLCSGQSNMEWTARMGIDNDSSEIAAAWHPRIRFFRVSHRTAATPQIDLDGTWSVCTPETMRDFSAVAYFFARRLQSELDVPIGLLNSSWGGTPAEVWMPAGTIDGDTLLRHAAARLQAAPWGPHTPARAFNAMIAPLTRCRIAGALWYQGESNVATADAYQQVFSALIASWRAAWGYDFPFYYAQIAPYPYGEPDGGALLRDAQRRTLALPRTGMVVASDIGDTTDIHPRNKQDVGLRLALLALHGHYGRADLTASGPHYTSWRAAGPAAVVTFAHSAGLHARGGAPSHFELAGPDGVFHPAQARIEDDRVVVQSAAVKKTAAVRYAWRNTATPNLFNAAGLPASCFSSETSQ